MAEDDPPLRDMLVFTLEICGYSVVSVDSCSAMLRELGASRSRVRLVVADTRLGSDCGISAVIAARACGWRGPVLFLAPFGNEEERSAARAVRDAFVLSRPFDGDQLRTWATAIVPLPRSGLAPPEA